MDLNIKLTPQLAEIVRQKIESGLYGSATDVVQAALHLLADADTAEATKLGHLRRDIQEGLASGAESSWDPEKIKKLGRSKMAAKAGGK